MGGIAAHLAQSAPDAAHGPRRGGHQRIRDWMKRVTGAEWEEEDSEVDSCAQSVDEEDSSSEASNDVPSMDGGKNEVDMDVETAGEEGELEEGEIVDEEVVKSPSKSESVSGSSLWSFVSFVSVWRSLPLFHNGDSRSSFHSHSRSFSLNHTCRGCDGAIVYVSRTECTPS